MRKGIFMILILLCLIIIPHVSARKGVGIVWSTETEIVSEGVQHCIEYGIYNPWDEDVYVSLSVSEELKKIINKEESEVKFIKAETRHEDAVPIEFCFIVPNVYEKDCLVGNFICAQECKEEEKVYDGDILAMEKPGEARAGGMGSATAMGVSVPLKLRVKCNPHPRGWTPVYIIVIVIVILIIFIILYKKHQKPVLEREKEKLKKLQEKIRKQEKSLKNRKK